jgi:hypothetical protein
MVSQWIDRVVVDMRYEASGIVKGNFVPFRVDHLVVIQDKTTSHFRDQWARSSSQNGEMVHSILRLVRSHREQRRFCLGGCHDTS